MISIYDTLYKEKPNAISINWEVTALCVYKCKYCNFIKDKKGYQHRSFEEIFNATKQIKKLYGDIFYQLCVTGGEPTLRSDFVDLINMYNTVLQNNRIVLLTNMFYGLETLEKKFTSIIEKEKIILVGSLHLDKVNHIEKFFNKAMYLNSLGFQKTEYKIIVPSWHLNKAYDAINILETKYEQLIPNIRIVRNFQEDFELPIKWKKYMSLDDIIIYKTDNEEKILSFNDMKDLGLNKTKGYKCMLGRQCLYISVEGYVFAALHAGGCIINPYFGCIQEQQTYDNIKQFLLQDIPICQDEFCNRECLMIIPKYNGS